MFASSFALGAFLVGILFAVQLIFGLYARTTVSAVAADLASRASRLTEMDSATLAEVASRGAQQLGEYGEGSIVTIVPIDRDLDGIADDVRVDITADLPTLLPTRWLGEGPSQFTRTVTRRIERFVEQRP